jgi:pyruvate/2-oxoglutarate dehydrogenase complex dihydrolipoamide dehydrogenase (E3) component
VRRDILPWVTFTDPELAHVGLSEEEAFRRYRDVQVLRWPFSENDRAQTERDTEGLVKVLTTRKGKIISADILGRDASELIAPYAVAVAEGLTVKSLVQTVLPYPTRSETAKRAAIAFYAPKLDTPLVKRMIRILRWFG